MPTLLQEQCCNCAVWFGLEESHKKLLLKNPGKSFYCPNGHSQHYVGETEKQKREKVEAELSRVRQQWSQAEDEYKAEIARTRKRSSAGTCPCCNRTFANMAAHMRQKHPDQVKDGSFAHVDVLAKQRSNVHVLQQVKRKPGRPRKTA